MPSPVDIAHHTRDNTLVITWADGRRDRLPARLLRGFCPCASCQGHSPGVRFSDPGEGVTVLAMEEVGAYALGLHFSDGHDTGVYTWEWLRELGGRARGPA
ncbi:MAG TPA: DUF971 domain-containing protein [Nannocystaceae bacterium]|nr:DUF971 domain-containing protein [Nannocystaceae bacterium]